MGVRLFPFYGSKVRLAPEYPKPMYDEIVEPFSGSAGYSCCYPDHKVTLYDKDLVIVAVLRYLIAATPTADEPYEINWTCNPGYFPPTAEVKKG